MIYLDNSATTRAFDSAAQAAVHALTEEYFNASAAYGPAVTADKKIRECREAVAAQVGARPEQVYFTSCGTESDNLAILGYARTLHKHANFVCSALEHPAVMETIRRVSLLPEKHEVRILPVDARGIVDLNAAEEMIDEETALVSCMQVSNETGAVQPLAELSALTKRKNPKAVFHSDGVQGFMRVPIHMGRMGVDLYSVSGHKIHGPKGIGVLVSSVRLLPQETGGGQEKGLRSGTYNTPGIFGLREAVRVMADSKDGLTKLAVMKAHLWERLSQTEGIRVNGPLPGKTDSAPHILSLSFADVRGEVMRNALEGEGILVSTGSACSSYKQKISPVMKAMGLSTEQADGTIRVSLGMFNTMEEMDTAADAMLKNYEMLRRFKRR